MSENNVGRGDRIECRRLSDWMFIEAIYWDAVGQSRVITVVYRAILLKELGSFKFNNSTGGTIYATLLELNINRIMGIYFWFYKN